MQPGGKTRRAALHRAAGTIAAACALALPITAAATAEAARIKHIGTVVGAPQALVELTVHKRRGELRAIRNLAIRRVPVRCADGTASLVEISTRRIQLAGPRFAVDSKVMGPQIVTGRGRTTGRLRAGGHRASGTVRVDYVLESGVQCTTGRLRWSSRFAPLA